MLKGPSSFKRFIEEHSSDSNKPADVHARAEEALVLMGSYYAPEEESRFNTVIESGLNAAVVEGLEEDAKAILWEGLTLYNNSMRVVRPRHMWRAANAYFSLARLEDASGRGLSALHLLECAEAELLKILSSDEFYDRDELAQERIIDNIRQRQGTVNRSRQKIEGRENTLNCLEGVVDNALGSDFSQAA